MKHAATQTGSDQPAPRPAAFFSAGQDGMVDPRAAVQAIRYARATAAAEYRTVAIMYDRDSHGWYVDADLAEDGPSFRFVQAATGDCPTSLSTRAGDMARRTYRAMRGRA